MHRSYCLPLSLFLIVIAIFFPVCGYDFLNYDDNLNIYSNALVSHPTLGSLLRFWTSPYEGLYIPLTYTIWAILAKIAAFLPPTVTSPVTPSVFHIANLLIHGLSTLVLFRILGLLLNNDWAAAAGALLFAIHPVQVEAVAWVTGMKSLLSGFFALISLWQYLLSIWDAGPKHKRKALYYTLALVFFLMALLANPGVVVLPLVAGLLGYFLLNRTILQLARPLALFFLFAIPVVIVTKLSQPDTNQEFLPTLWQRFFIVGDALSFYLAKILLPIGLGPDYGRTPAYVLSQSHVYATGVIPYLLFGAGAWKVRNPWLLAATGVFVAVLLPVLGFLPFDFQAISTVADRYLYLAFMGPALGVGWLLSRYNTKAVWIGAAVVFLLWAGQSIATVSHWQNSTILSSYIVDVNPRSWVAPTMLAAAEIDRKNFTEAVADCERSVAANPGYWSAYLTLGAALEGMKRPEEAALAYRQVLELRPAFLPAYNYLTDIYIHLGRLDEANALFQKAMEIYTSGTELRREEGMSENRASLYNTNGRLQSAQNKPDLAIESFKQAIAAFPFSAETYNDLGNAYLAANRYTESVEAYQEAVKLLPTLAFFHNNLCLAYSLINRNDAALASCKTAMTLDPLYADPSLLIGNVMMALNKPEEALVAYQKALDLAPKFDLAAYNLGFVYQTRGNFSEAMTYYQRALEINPNFVKAREGLSQLSQELNMKSEAGAKLDL